MTVQEKFCWSTTARLRLAFSRSSVCFISFLTLPRVQLTHWSVTQVALTRAKFGVDVAVSGEELVSSALAYRAVLFTINVRAPYFCQFETLSEELVFGLMCGFSSLT